MFYSYAKQNSQYNTQGEKHSTYDNSFNEKKSNFKFKNFSFNWENFIYKNTQKQSDKEVKLPINGKDVNTEIEISLSESIEGVTKIINLLQTGTCPKCNGRKFVNGSICPYCSGKGKYTAYKKFTVKIPAGIKNNSKIRLAKEGEVGVNGGLNGDLYITVKIRQEDKYHTEGLNVFQTVPISPSKAVLGGEIKISSLNGEYKVKIAPKTQNGQKIRLSGCGIVQNNKVGDMIITVEIKIPKNLTNEELDLYRKLEQISSENIREY
ncbi:MAG: hypothetical protein MJ237_04770 [bacterium]|nr:hypothetical protein [bacterium]